MSALRLTWTVLAVGVAVTGCTSPTRPRIVAPCVQPPERLWAEITTFPDLPDYPLSVTGATLLADGRPSGMPVRVRPLNSRQDRWALRVPLDRQLRRADRLNLVAHVEYARERFDVEIPFRRVEQGWRREMEKVHRPALSWWGGFR